MESSHPHEEHRDLNPWRVAAFAGGGLSVLGALYIFYLHPWLGWSTPVDGWIDQRFCLFPQLCTSQIPLPNQLGIVAIGLALVLFGVALWPDRTRQSRSEQVTPWRVIVITVLALFGLSAILVQAVQAGSRNQSPSPALWLIGILTLGAIAVLWDVRSVELLAKTVASLMAAIGAALMLIGVGVAIAVPANAIWLLVAGCATFCCGLFLLSPLAPPPWQRRSTPVDDPPDPSNSKTTSDDSTRLPNQGSNGIEGQRDGLLPLDYLILLGLGLVALLLGIWRIDSWRYAFVGDEWGFYDLATTLIHRPELHSLFSVVDANAYHTVFSSMIQASVMQLAGENVYGWRLSSLLPVVLSVPAIYAFGHWLSGRTTAMIAAGLLAVSHMLLSFSMVAYNNTQALLPLSLGLAFFAFAQRRDSALRYYLLGAVLGSSFLVFGLARLTLLPIGLLILFFYWTSVQRAVKSMIFILMGGVAVAAPLLFNLDNWRGLLKATPIQSEAVEQGVTLGNQLLRNGIAGFTAFLVNEHNTHFVAGPHVDPLTAILVLVGFVATLLAWRQRPMLAWLLASLSFWLAVSAIQQYEWISTTRMFVLVPIYALYAGLGGTALARLFFGENYRKQMTFSLAIVLVGLVLNQVHILRVAQAQSPIRAESLLVREFQDSAASDGSGIPIYVIWAHSDTRRESMIVGAHDIDPGRIRFLTADEALAMQVLCDEERPQMLLVHADIPELEAIDAYIGDCWPVHEEMILRNENGDERLRRYMTLAGLDEVIVPVSERLEQRPDPERLHVPSPIDVAVDGADSLFVLSTDPPAIWQFDVDGRLVKQVLLAQLQPTALTISDDGLLVVAGSGPDASLVWYDAGGQVVRRQAIGGVMGVVTALATGEDGDLFVADAALGQVTRLGTDGQILGILNGNGTLNEPIAVSMASDDAIWVLDRPTNNWYKLSFDDDLLATVPAGAISAHDAPGLIETGDTELLVSQQTQQRLGLLDGDGNLLDGLGSFRHPSAIDVDAEGRVYVTEHELDRVNILLPSSLTRNVERAPVRTESSATGDYGLLDLNRSTDGFLSPLSPLSPLPLVQSIPDAKPINQSLRVLSGDGGGLSRPRAVGAGIEPTLKTPYVYVGDADGGGLLVIDHERDIRTRAEEASPPLKEVSDIAVDADGTVYLLDSATGYIHRFAANGAYVDAISSDRELVGDARGLDVDAQGNLWVANTRGGDIVKIDRDGQILARTGIMPVQDSQPVDVAIDEEGNLYVVDARTARLLHLSPTGDLLGAWALSPFNSADGAHLALDANGNLYVTQPEQGQVFTLSPEGELTNVWSVMTDGQARRAKPVGIAVDEAGGIWVADVDGNTIVLLED